MEFEFVLKKMLKELQDKEIRYSLIGGFGMGVLGITRATFDIDFLIHKSDLDKLHKIVTNIGYELYFKTENVSHYASKDQALGSIDFIHAFRETSLKMLERRVEKRVFQGKVPIYVLEPEDLIGLKIQAMANDPQREFREMADIEAVISLYKKDLKWGRIKEYFDLFSMDDKYQALRERFINAE
ncbi:MAG: nucleotidyltransferase [Candidatus Kaelpia imicola]|nr:nucleotidyltransferase [Candidatus Kaelpia imicola]